MELRVYDLPLMLKSQFGSSSCPLFGDGACLYRSLSFFYVRHTGHENECSWTNCHFVTNNSDEFSVMSRDCNGDNYSSPNEHYADKIQRSTYGGEERYLYHVFLRYPTISFFNSRDSNSPELLSFTMTISKCQGQTLKIAEVDLRQDCFLPRTVFRGVFECKLIPKPGSTPVVQWLSYSPLDPRFAGSNPPAVDGFFESIKILSMTSLEREVKPLVP